MSFLHKGHSWISWTLRVVILTSSFTLLVIGMSGTLWGIMGALTLNTPPFDPKTYVDHEKAPIRIKTLLHLNPFTLLLYNVILVLIGSAAGMITFISRSVLTSSIYFGTVLAALTSQYFLGYSLYWDPNVMRRLMGTMEGAMQNYNVRSSGQGGLLFLSNATEYWDMMQLSRDCCGLTEPDDWIRTSFYSQFNNSFPKSCCNSNDTPLRCGLGTFGEYADGFAALKTRGCISTFPEGLTTEFQEYSFIANTVGMILIGSACASLLSLLLSICQSCLNLNKKNVKERTHAPLAKRSAEVGQGRTGFSEIPPSRPCDLPESSDTKRVPQPTEFGIGDFTGNSTKIGTKERFPLPEISLDKFKQSYSSASIILRDRSHRIGTGTTTARNFPGISNVLFPATSSLRSYVQGIFKQNTKDQATHPSRNDTSVGTRKRSNLKAGVSSAGYRLQPEEKGDADVYVSLEPRKSLGKGEIIVPSLLSIPKAQRAHSSRIVFHNEVNTSRFKFGFGDRKSETRNSSISKSKTLLRLRSPTRIHPVDVPEEAEPDNLAVQPESVSSSRSGSSDYLHTLYRYPAKLDSDDSDECSTTTSTTAESLEGLYISPSADSVNIVLNPMFDHSSSETDSSMSSVK